MILRISCPYLIPLGKNARICIIEAILHNLLFTLQQIPVTIPEIIQWNQRICIAEAEYLTKHGKKPRYSTETKKAMSFANSLEMLMKDLDAVSSNPTFLMDECCIVFGPNYRHPNLLLHISFIKLSTANVKYPEYPSKLDSTVQYSNVVTQSTFQELSEYPFVIPQSISKLAHEMCWSNHELPREEKFDEEKYFEEISNNTRLQIMRKVARVLITNSFQISGTHPVPINNVSVYVRLRNILNEELESAEFLSSIKSHCQLIRNFAVPLCNTVVSQRKKGIKAKRKRNTEQISMQSIMEQRNLLIRNNSEVVDSDVTNHQPREDEYDENSHSNTDINETEDSDTFSQSHLNTMQREKKVLCWGRSRYRVVSLSIVDESVSDKPISTGNGNDAHNGLENVKQIVDSDYGWYRCSTFLQGFRFSLPSPEIK